jgi:tyrosine-specific transport protein
LANKIIGGALLVAGTCIGAGMLGLPVSTAAAGFYYSAAGFGLCWSLMTLTAFFMLEVTLWYDQEVNLITMARNHLGRGGALAVWITYVLFLYTLMAAYTSGGAAIMAFLLQDMGISVLLSTIIFVLLFATVVYKGTGWVDSLNRLMVAALILVYFLLLGLTLPQVQAAQINTGHPQYLWVAVPIMVTSFGYHLLIPSLKTYLNGNLKHLRLSLYLGSLIPLLVYLLWEYIILGILPIHGDPGLVQMLHHGQPVVTLTNSLQTMVGSAKIGLLAKLFSFFAIITSFIGVALGLFDFFADGFNIERNPRGKLVLVALTFLPPAIFAATYPQGFIFALSYAGIFAALLLIIYPALMVLRGRAQQLNAPFQVPGGKSLAWLAVMAGIMVIVLQLLTPLNWLPSP